MSNYAIISTNPCDIVLECKNNRIPIKKLSWSHEYLSSIGSVSFQSNNLLDIETYPIEASKFFEVLSNIDQYKLSVYAIDPRSDEVDCIMQFKSFLKPSKSSLNEIIDLKKSFQIQLIANERIPN